MAPGMEGMDEAEAAGNTKSETGGSGDHESADGARGPK